MAPKTYTINLGGLEHLNPLKDGTVRPKSFDLEIIEISPMPAGILTISQNSKVMQDCGTPLYIVFW